MYQFIVLFNAAFFQKRVNVSEEYFDFQTFGNQQMFRKLAAVVSGDRPIFHIVRFDFGEGIWGNLEICGKCIIFAP